MEVFGDPHFMFCQWYFSADPEAALDLFTAVPVFERDQRR